MKVFLFTTFMLLLIGAITYWGIIPYTSIGNPENSFLHMLSSTEAIKAMQPKDYYDAKKEAAKEKLLRENNGSIEYMTQEERRIIYYQDYDEAENIPEFAYWMTLVLMFTGYYAIWCGSKEFMSISLVLCVILIFFSWKLIALALLTDIVFIPMAFAAVISSLFKKD